MPYLVIEMGSMVVTPATRPAGSKAEAAKGTQCCTAQIKDLRLSCRRVGRGVSSNKVQGRGLRKATIGLLDHAATSRLPGDNMSDNATCMGQSWLRSPSLHLQERLHGISTVPNSRPPGHTTQGGVGGQGSRVSWKSEFPVVAHHPSDADERVMDGWMDGWGWVR